MVGAGIHGAAVAWDAAQRGLAVALVEREDFGAGASWNSLKTIHGGMRHLQRLDVASLRESARERRTLLRVAPELVEPLRFLVPCRGYGSGGRAALAVGLMLNDLLTRDRNRGLPAERQIPDGRTTSAAEALALVPGLEPRGLGGAALWHDAQAVSTERLLLGFVHAAADAGAAVANHVEALALVRGPRGRVAGVALRDALGGSTLELRARLVVNAAGPWMDELGARSGLRRSPLPLLRARNLVLRRPCPVPLAVGARSEGRFLFLVPWQGRSIVGTSYEPAAAPPSDPLAFLDEARRAFPWAGFECSDLALVHEGLVPGEGGPHGLWTRSRRRRPRERRRDRGARQPPGRQVHDGTRRGRAGRRPLAAASRAGAGRVPDRRDPPSREHAASRARSTSALASPCARRWRCRSPTPSCAGSTSGRPARRPPPTSPRSAGPWRWSFAGTRAREQAERAALASFFARRSACERPARMTRRPS